MKKTVPTPFIKKLFLFFFSKIQLIIDTIQGFFLYYFKPKKTFVIIASAMRSGSTLLKALLAEAPEIQHLNEKNFQIKANKYAAYFRFYHSGTGNIVVLKKPAYYDDYSTYPVIPNLKHKKIILVRNPIDTILSMQKTPVFSSKEINLAEQIDLWVTTYKNLAAFLGDKNVFVVQYEKLLSNPIETTQQLYEFIASKRKTGTDSYSDLDDGEWVWTRDDGGENIKQYKVVKNKKSYNNDLDTIQILASNRDVQELVKLYNLQLPNINL